MPWHVTKSDSSGKPYKVVKDSNGAVVGSHTSRSSANKQLAALYANVPDAKKK